MMEKYHFDDTFAAYVAAGDASITHVLILWK